MSRKLLAILALVLGQLSRACTAHLSGYDVRYGANDYTEWHVGNSPLIILSQHGGWLKPDSIADRQNGCWNGTHCLWTAEQGCIAVDDPRRSEQECRAKTLSDSFTYQLATCLANRTLLNSNSNSPTGNSEEHILRPHLIASALHRSKLDPNREEGEACQGNAEACEAWREIHEHWIPEAQQAARRSRCNFTLMIDVHGQAANDFNQLGYRVTDSNMEKDDTALDADANIAKSSSVYALVSGGKHGLAEVVRGPWSLGTLINRTGYKMFPSEKLPQSMPEGLHYYIGGYSLKTHAGLRNKVTAIQIEATSDIRFDAGKRDAFCVAFSDALVQFVDRFYALNDSCVLSGDGGSGDTGAPTLGPTGGGDSGGVTSSPTLSSGAVNNIGPCMKLFAFVILIGWFLS